MLPPLKIVLVMWVGEFIGNADDSLSDQVTKSSFVKDDGLPCILPIGTTYSASSEEFGGEFQATISEIEYDAQENKVRVELSLDIRHESDYDLAIMYLLNPKNGWRQE